MSIALQKFNLLMLNDLDMSCFERAVKALLTENRRIPCDFTADPEKVHYQIPVFNSSEVQILSPNQQAANIYFVFDNTPYLEALQNNKNYSAEAIAFQNKHGNLDMDITSKVVVTYIQTNLHEKMVHIFTIVMCVASLLLVVVLSIYLHKRRIHMRLSYKIDKKWKEKKKDGLLAEN